MSSRRPSRGKRRRRKSEGGNGPAKDNASASTVERDETKTQAVGIADDAFDAGVFESECAPDATPIAPTDTADEGDEGDALEKILDAAPPVSNDEHDVADEPETEECTELVEVAATEPADAAVVEIAAAAEEISLLKAELAARDELVSALTVQLEDAADRLDRLRRAGADRSPPPPRQASSIHEASFPIEEQLERLVDAWDHFESSAPFAALERKLDQLQTLLRASDRPAIPYRELTDEDRAYLPGAPTDGNPRGESLAAWEQMKAKLLSGDAASPEESSTELEPHPVQKVDEPPIDPPEAIDFDAADRLDLEEAILRRDDYISYLIRKYRSSPAGRHEAVNWQSLSGAPEELRDRLEDLEGRLQELLRMEECDLSLERARLARERARLDQMSRELTRSDGADDGEAEASRDERRWLRVFGFGRKGDDVMADHTKKS